MPINTDLIRVSKSFKAKVDKLRGRMSTAGFLDSVELLVASPEERQGSKRSQLDIGSRLSRIEQSLGWLEKQLSSRSAENLSPAWLGAVDELMEARRAGDSSGLSEISRLLLQGTEENWSKLGLDTHFGSPLDSKLDAVFEKLLLLTASVLEFYTSMARQSQAREEASVFVGKDQ